MFLFRVLFCFFVAVSLIGNVFGGSCREAKLCCPGRDSSCVVQKAPINAIIEDLSDKPCYCDHACLKLGDCCTDFKEACGGKSHFFFYSTMNRSLRDFIEFISTSSRQ